MLRGSIIELIFQRGKFDSIGTELTTRVLIIYAFSLVFYSCYGIINKLVFSLELIKELLVSIVIIFTVKIVLNAYLVKIYQQNGLAIATSFCYTLMFLFGYLIINMAIKLKEKGELLFSFLFYVVLNSLLFIIVQVLLMAFDKTTLLLNITGVVIHLVLFLLSLIIINPDEFKTMTGKFNFIYTMISKKSER
jgi:peptidoglycan biosynthesis protein MviN/MurJ (putative lipid II flippase)